MDTMGIVIISALLLFVISMILVFAAVFSARSQGKADKQSQIWKGIAEGKGWSFDQKRREISGTHRGKQFKVDQFEPSRSLLGGLLLIFGFQSGRGNQAVRQLSGRVRVRMKLANPSNHYMSLVEKVNTSSAENLMFKQAQTAIEEIDSHFSVESKPAGFAAGVLATKELRDQILGLHQHHRISLVVNKDELNLQIEGLPISDSSILDIVDVACDAAEAIERVAEGTRWMNHS